MEIYKTNNKNIFYTIFNLDNKRIELDFVLTVPEHFYCDIFIQNKKNVKSKTYSTIQQYSFKNYDFVIPRKEFEKIITTRQILLIKKAIKRAYRKILKIKFEAITENQFVISEKQVAEYEIYRKHIDHM